MMRLLIFLFSGVALIAGVGLASAEKARKSAAPAALNSRGTPTKTASGVVKAFHPDSLIVVVGKARGRETEWTFALDAATTVRSRGRAATPGDLRTGDRVTVRYTDQDGKSLAQSIAVTAGPRPARSTRPR